jgi:hypothetical protein
MKYLKLFENFDDILYDIEDILVTLNPADTNSTKPELLRSELDNNLLFYKVEHNYTIEENITAERRLNDIDYEILKDTNYGMVLIKSDYFKDKTIKGVCLQWLNEKFGKGKLKIDKDPKAINYVNDNGENIIRFYKDKDDNFLINNDLVWSLFNKGFILSYNTTQEIISTWLKETYKLTGKANCFSWGVMDEDNLED